MPGRYFCLFYEMRPIAPTMLLCTGDGFWAPCPDFALCSRVCAMVPRERRMLELMEGAFMQGVEKHLRITGRR